MSFRDNLQRLRARDGLTQEQFALMLGVSRQAVSKWEAERAYPEMDKLLRMCDLFGCTLDELVRGDVVATGSSESGRQLENEGSGRDGAPGRIVWPSVFVGRPAAGQQPYCPGCYPCGRDGAHYASRA